MSEQAPPGFPARPSGPAPQALTPEAVEGVLADFRAWLQQVVTPPAGNGEAGSPPQEPLAPAPDLHTLLGQLVALRQEVNLQTRAARGQQEQSAEGLRQLAQALDLLRQKEEASPPSHSQDVEEVLRPLLKTLVDLHDALALAAREIQRVDTSLLHAVERLAAEDDPAPSLDAPDNPAVQKPSLLGRLFGADKAWASRQAELAHRRQRAQRRQEEAAQASARVRQLVTSMVTGYTMSVQRLERALEQHGLEPIPALGQPFDPEIMEAVDVVARPGLSTTEVTEEVRRGYLWRGRVFRFALVKVARPER